MFKPIISYHLLRKFIFICLWLKDILFLCMGPMINFLLKRKYIPYSVFRVIIYYFHYFYVKFNYRLPSIWLVLQIQNEMHFQNQIVLIMKFIFHLKYFKTVRLMQLLNMLNLMLTMPYLKQSEKNFKIQQRNGIGSIIILKFMDIFYAPFI